MNMLRAKMADADTPERIAERARYHAAACSAITDREAKFGPLTTENAAEAMRYQEERIKFYVEGR